MSLSGGDVKELDAHPLADIYFQELVRCETVRLMQDGSLYDARQIEEHLRTLIESGDHIFLLDYDGAILSYGRDGMRHSLRRDAEVLAQRLEHCFAPA